MPNQWSVVVPSDCEASLSLSVDAVFKMHEGIDPRRIFVPSKALKASGVAAEHLKGVSFVNDQSNFCYARRVNLAIKACAPDDVVIMGDDVELMTKYGFDLMAEEAPSGFLRHRSPGGSVRGGRRPGRTTLKFPSSRSPASTFRAWCSTRSAPSRKAFRDTATRIPTTASALVGRGSPVE
jgi:hypothetical protein